MTADEQGIKPPTRRWRSRLETAALVSMIAAAGALVAIALEERADRKSDARAERQRRQPPPIPISPISLKGAAAKGTTSARVVLLVFSDFECPFCAKFARHTMPELERLYLLSGKLRLVFRHMPIPELHPFATAAAETAWCADRQGSFWRMHDELFANPGRLAEDDLREHARRIGLDASVLNRCRRDGEAKAAVGADVTLAREMRIGSTPSSLIAIRQGDGHYKPMKWLIGLLPLSEYQAEIDKALGIAHP